jgi:transcription elongation factor
VESCEPDFRYGYVPDVPPKQADATRSPLFGRFVLVVGKTPFKGYVGYVRSLAEKVAHIELEANHHVVALPKGEIIDL